MLFHLLFLISGVVGGCELLGDFFSKQVFQELRLLDAGSSTEASGLDLYLSFFGDIDNDLFHVLFLQLLIHVWMLIGIALRGYTGGVRWFWGYGIMVERTGRVSISYDSRPSFSSKYALMASCLFNGIFPKSSGISFQYSLTNE